MQRILVFQRDKRGDGKVAAVRELRPDLDLRVVDVEGPCPAIVDEPEPLFPANLADLLAGADLVIDHLYHPDLTGYLLDRCEAAGVPVVASGRKLPRAHTPTTCCTLGRLGELGEYARSFGAPELEVELAGGRVTSVRVVRGAPCAATWRAAPAVVGLTPEEAVPRMGLATQFHCFAKANPNVFLINPLHVAGEVHAAALAKALRTAAGNERGPGG
ncbi:MAG: DUF166 family protein [Deferrisomatales bacterium]|nr:DUF166 family protein [Deferrisomatales bacterium]